MIAAGPTAIPLLDCSIGARLHDTVARFPDRPAVLWAEGLEIRQLTYSGLLRESTDIAHWIRAQTAPGDRVAIWSSNSLEWILLEYACALAGTIVTAWNPAWTDPECLRARELTSPRLIFAGSARGSSLLARAQALADGRPVHALDTLRVRAAAAPAHGLPLVAPHDVFLLQFTSGTTGRPKAAALTHRASLNTAWLRARLFDADESDVWLNPVPMNHVGGAIAMLLGAMVTGGAYVLMNRYEPGEYLRLMKTCGVTRVGGVPTMFVAALEHPDWGTTRSVRSIGLGGAQIPQTLIARLREAFKAPVLSTYGQSECPLITTTVPGDDPHRALETVGQVAPHVELKICSLHDGQQQPVGAVGEILVRAPTMMTGYFGMPEATATAFDADGFLHTGDLGSIDGEGYLRIHGRARDVIIRGGENIYPAEVEDALLQHPAVALIGVVGVPDPRWGQTVAAAVVLRAAATADANELQAFAAARLAHFKVPRRWRFERQLPLNASGKIQKLEVEKMFRQEPN
jgi:fatty-acyl-CoA synthase